MYVTSFSRLILRDIWYIFFCFRIEWQVWVLYAHQSSVLYNAFNEGYIFATSDSSDKKYQANVYPLVKRWKEPSLQARFVYYLLVYRAITIQRVIYMGPLDTSPNNYFKPPGKFSLGTIRSLTLLLALISRILLLSSTKLRASSFE